MAEAPTGIDPAYAVADGPGPAADAVVGRPRRPRSRRGDRSGPPSSPPTPQDSREQRAALAVYWLASRVVMLALLRRGQGDIAREVHRLYRGWAATLAHGAFPDGDVAWQYPPGAALVMLAPRWVPYLTYLQAFVLLMLAADAVTTAGLLRAAGRAPGRSLLGAWYWVLGLPLMLHLSFARFDVLAAAIAVLALLALPRRPRLGGAVAGIGALVKIWPVLTVLGTPRGRTTRQAWTALAASAAVLLLVLTARFRGAFGFLTAQRHRGVEAESLGGTVLHLARLAGGPLTVRWRYGSMEYLGPYVSAVAWTSMALTAAAFAWLLAWRLRARRWSEATPYDAALAAVLLFIVTSRVISPQYLVWLIGLAAVCLTVRETTQRPVAALVLFATAVTTVDYPLFFGAITHGSWKGFAVLALRNGLLAGAAVLSCVRLWRASMPTPSPSPGSGASSSSAGSAGPGTHPGPRP